MRRKKARELQEMAEECRALALAAKREMVRQELLAIAEQFEALARQYLDLVGARAR